MRRSRGGMMVNARIEGDGRGVGTVTGLKEEGKERKGLGTKGQ